MLAREWCARAVETGEQIGPSGQARARFRWRGRSGRRYFLHQSFACVVIDEIRHNGLRHRCTPKYNGSTNRCSDHESTKNERPANEISRPSTMTSALADHPPIDRQPQLAC
jgi:hypothetical protein